MLSRAIVKLPSMSFALGETSVDLGEPDFDRVLQQHQAYCDALESCGLELIRLPDEEDYPDSTFVEDTALLTSSGAVLTRPGAESRRREVESIAIVVRD